MSDTQTYDTVDQTVDPVKQRQDLVERKLNMERSAEILVSEATGSLVGRNLADLFELAKFMSLAKAAVPAYLHGNPWDCLSIISDANDWGMSPWRVARMSYLTQGQNGEQTIAYMSQLVHALIEKRAPIQGRLKVKYEGEGDDRVCIVWATLTVAEGGDIVEYRSPRLGDRRPRPQERTNRRTGEKYMSTAGSPLWQTKPDLQQFYDASRDLARRDFPDVLMGIYDREEMIEAGFEDITNRDLKRMPAQQQVDIEDKLSTRLTGTALERAGFNLGGVVAEANAAHANGNASQSPTDSDAEAAGSVMPLSEPAASKPKQTRTRKAKETTPTPDTSPSAAPATTSDENLPTQSQVVVPTEEASQAVAAAAEPPPETPAAEMTEERRAQLTEARKAGGRAYYNGQPRSEGQRKYPADEGSRAAWHEGYDERRDRERGSARG